jgi:hypothetical protein
VVDALKLKSNEQTTADSLLKLAHTIDQFEQYTRPHASQIAYLAESIAIRLGISGADLNAIKIAALMHDIGELAMDAPAVRSTGYLDFKYRIELWRHPVIGEQQLAKRGLPRQVQFLVRWHHEWWNGSGYPDMLSGEAIPIGARILRLADSFDALTAWRPFREPFTEEQAIEIIAASAGLEFDPVVVKIFFQLLEEMRPAPMEIIEPATIELETEPTEEPPVEIAISDQAVAETEVETEAAAMEVASEIEPQIEESLVELDIAELEMVESKEVLPVEAANIEPIEEVKVQEAGKEDEREEDAENRSSQ